MEKDSKKIKHHSVDDKEDLKIRKIAYKKNKNYGLITLIVVLVLVSITTVFYFYSYKKINKPLNDSKNVTEIVNEKNRVLIINAGDVQEKIISNEDDKYEEITIIRKNSIEIFAKKEAIDNEFINYNVKLDVKKNDFVKNFVSTNKSELLLRVSYSYDDKSWTYINNVLTVDNTTISPLMGNHYDIAGINSTIKIATNHELAAKPNESKKMYWRMELIIKNSKKEYEEKNLNMNFYIEYKEKQ